MRKEAIRLTLGAAGLALCLNLSALPMYEKGDPIDLGFPILTALEKAERACLCHEGDGMALRNKTFRLLAAIEGSSRGYGPLVRFPDSLVAGIRTNGTHGCWAIHIAHARLLQTAGKLYDHPEFVSRGRQLEEKVRKACGCTTAKLIAKGARVKFVAVCNGNIGHHKLSRKETAATRRQETLNAAKVWGLDSYDIYGYEDAGVPYDIPTREVIARRIQEFEPDIIITHRDCDYHVDHRTVGMHVKDCGYMLGCPHWIEGSKALRRRPLILLMNDFFTVPRTLRPDIVVNCEPYIEKWCEALNCQVSQFYEWLAWDKGIEDEVAAIGDRSKNIVGRNAYLKKYWAASKEKNAVRFADAWREQYLGKPVPKMLEAYEISEYGRPPIEEDFELLMGD